MKAVLYVAHGSRVEEGNQQAISFLKEVQKEIQVPIQEICFLELVEPTVEQGMTNCILKGATEIAIVPILLLTAKHAKKDIPLKIERGKQQYPKVKFSYGRPLSIDHRLIQTIYKRIVESNIPITNKSEVLLIGRGSSDPAAWRDFLEIATQLKLKFGIRKVEIAFLYGKGPQFDTYLQTLKERQSEQLFIVPYLLFQGKLRQGIDRKLNETKIPQNVIICNSLGYDECVKEVVVDRVREVLNPFQLKEVVI